MNDSQPPIIKKLIPLLILSISFIIKEREHEILGSLPFDQNTPVIGGYNSFKAKEHALTILSASEYKAQKKNRDVELFRGNISPLLVTGNFGSAKTAAFAGDVAPHWVGPFVDWGDKRVITTTPGAETIEVGCWYAEFFSSLIKWLCKKDRETISRPI